MRRHQETRPESLAHLRSLKSSQRKRSFFFATARYAFVQADREASSVPRDFVGFRSQPAGYPALTPHGHRGVSASSFCDGAIRFLYGLSARLS